MSQATTADEAPQIEAFDTPDPVEGALTTLSVFAAIVAEMRRLRCDAQRRYSFMDT